MRTLRHVIILATFAGGIPLAGNIHQISWDLIHVPWIVLTVCSLIGWLAAGPTWTVAVFVMAVSHQVSVDVLWCAQSNKPVGDSTSFMIMISLFWIFRWIENYSPSMGHLKESYSQPLFWFRARYWTSGGETKRKAWVVALELLVIALFGSGVVRATRIEIPKIVAWRTHAAFARGRATRGYKYAGYVVEQDGHWIKTKSRKESESGGDSDGREAGVVDFHAFVYLVRPREEWQRWMSSFDPSGLPSELARGRFFKLEEYIKTHPGHEITAMRKFDNMMPHSLEVNSRVWLLDDAGHSSLIVIEHGNGPYAGTNFPDRYSVDVVRGERAVVNCKDHVDEWDGPKIGAKIARDVRIVNWKMSEQGLETFLRKLSGNVQDDKSGKRLSDAFEYSFWSLGLPVDILASAMKGCSSRE